MRLARFIGVTIAATIWLGCERPDTGKECPLLETTPPSSGGTRVETDEIVAQDFRFDCQELICVATDGRAGYCSAKCREDAGCPAGFECRQVQSLGDFARDKFCVWKRCEQPKDCGSKDEFRCCHPALAVYLAEIENDRDLSDDERDQAIKDTIWAKCGGAEDKEGLSLATGEEIKLCTFRE